MNYYLSIILLFISIHIFGQTEVNRFSPGGKYLISDTTVKFNKKQNGLKQGWWKYYYYPTRVKRIEFYQNGEINGEVIEFYSDGFVKSKCHYVNNKKNGICILYKDLRKKNGSNRVYDRPCERFEYRNDSLIRKLPPKGHQNL